MRLYLIRHGEAAAHWGESTDSGLSDLGRQQAKGTANELARFGELPIVSSPLARAHETAQIAAEGRAVSIEPRVGEIPTPEHLTDRAQWLKGVMQKNWPELDDASLQNWRQQGLEALRELEQDTLIFTHFMFINMVVGEAIGNPAVVHSKPDHASVTVLDLTDNELTLVEAGCEMTTEVL